MVTKSLENIRQGVRLLNVRQQDSVTYATVFIPAGQERFFLDRVEAYGDPSRVSEKGTAPNEKLISSIEDIRLAIVDSLWTGREENRPGTTRQWLEIWLRTNKDENGSSFADYAALLDTLKIKHKNTYILFPERMVTLAYANKDELAALVTSRPLDNINATSAAVAEAAYMAAELENAYPDLWPETIGGLLVHSARWSQAMINRYAPKGSAEDTATKGRRRLLRSCGYGIPDLARAIECRENSVNLIIQGSLCPYMVKNGRETMREMHFHTLPWPKDVLTSLADVDATLHVTLSYYIEPGPGQIGWKDRYRYASHGLRFDVNKPGESWGDFEKRINVSVRDEDESKTSSGSGEWYLGVNNRNVGSIHSDYKFTSAIELSDIEYVAVNPVIGWWRSRKYLGKINSEARYSLIVSIETPGVEIDLYSEIAQAIENMSATVIPIATSDFE